VPRRTRSLEESIAPDDPTLIPGIYNYCFRICERCPFTGRCAVFLEMEREQQTNPAGDTLARVHDAVQQTFDRLRDWCSRQSIDFAQLTKESESLAVEAELARIDATRADPLQKLAELYMRAAVRLTRALRGSPEARGWPDHVGYTLDTISFEMIPVAAKVHRALSGFVCRDEALEPDPIQSDWNGSAKVARLMLADSKAAWEVLFDLGRAPADAPVRQVVRLLDEIDDGLARRFPHAMDFVRPGFDRSDIAAGPVPK
jgi:hypothetical protein